MSAKHNTTPRLPDHLPPLTDEDGEVRELTAEDMAHFRPMKDVFPEIVEAFERARGKRGPQKTPTKERVALRLDRNIVDHFRHDGPGWQTRINDALAELVKRNAR